MQKSCLVFSLWGQHKLGGAAEKGGQESQKEENNVTPKWQKHLLGAALYPLQQRPLQPTPATPLLLSGDLSRSENLSVPLNVLKSWKNIYQK